MRWIHVLLAIVIATLLIAPVQAADPAKLRRQSAQALDRLYQHRPGARPIIERAAGVLIFPSVFKGGFGIGGEFGDGVLQEGGEVTGYFRIVAGSIGFQLGAQKRAQIIAFMDADVLRKFKNSDGWEAGVEGSAVFIDKGAGVQADTKTIQQPIIGFILGGKGLMYNASIEGSKITRLEL